jgi:hypothetical protein
MNGKYFLEDRHGFANTDALFSQLRKSLIRLYPHHPCLPRSIIKPRILSYLRMSGKFFLEDRHRFADTDALFSQLRKSLIRSYPHHPCHPRSIIKRRILSYLRMNGKYFLEDRHRFADTDPIFTVRKSLIRFDPHYPCHPRSIIKVLLQTSSSFE